MSHDQEQCIRTRAYELWEQAGCTGSADEHWCRAERELASPADMEAPSAAAERSLSVAGVSVARACGSNLPSFYDSLPGEGPPLRHWELAIELAAGPEDSFRSLLGDEAQPAI